MCGTGRTYDMTCLQCCVRLVASAWGNKAAASGLLAAIARFRGAPSREQILRELKKGARG